MYTLKILEDKDFDALPYAHVGTAFGCADPKTKTAYVRNTHWGEVSKVVNLLNIQHELDELIAKTSPHEIDGIRYKSESNFFNTIPGKILTSVVGIAAGGPLLGGAIGGLTGMGSTMATALGSGLGSALTSAGGQAIGTGRVDPLSTAISGVTGALGGAGMAPGIAASKAAGGGLLGQSLSGLQSMVGITPGAAAKTAYGAGTPVGTVNTGTMSQFPAGYTSTASTFPTTTAPSSLGVGQTMLGNAAGYTQTVNSVSPYGAYGNPSNMAGASGPAASNINTAMSASPYSTGNGIGSAISLPSGTPTGVHQMTQAGTSQINIGQSPGISQIAGQPIKTAGNFASTMGDALKNPMTLMGLGSMSLSALPMTPSIPNLGDITAKWLTADSVTRAGQKAREMAEVNYTGDFTPSKETMGLIDVLQGDIQKAYKQRKKDLDRVASASNSQWMSSGERLEMYRRIDEQEQTEMTRVEKELIANAQQEFAQRQFEYVMGNLQADEQTKRDLLYGELSEVIAKYNMKEADVMNFRKIAADAGMYMVQQGTNMK